MPSAPTRRRRHPAPSRSGAGARWLVLLTAVAALVAACGSPGGSGEEGAGRSTEGDAAEELPECPLDALEEADGPVEVNLWYGGLVEPPVVVLSDMIDEFNASQDQIQVTGNDQGTSYEEVLRQYERTAGTPGQLPDIVYTDAAFLGQMVDRGQLLPAQACMEADGFDIDQLVPAVQAASSVDGVLYPGYMNVSTPVLYFNQAHFQQAGLDPNEPPGTLEELAEAARALKEAGTSSKPLSFLANDWFLQTWIGGAGEDVVDNDNGRSAPATEANLDSEPAREALEWLRDMNDEGLLNPFPVTEGSINHYLALLPSPDGSTDSSMLIETSTASGTISAALGGEIDPSEEGIEIDPGLLESANVVPGSGMMPGIDEPGQVAPSGGSFYILNTGDPAEVAGAWKFLSFMLEDANAKRWHIEGGYLPVLDSIVDDPDVEEFQRTDLAGLLLAPSVQQLAEADPDRSGPLIGPYIQYKEILQSAMEDVLFSGVDPGDAVTSADEELDQALSEYNE